MIARGTFLLIAAFWVAMNVLLWRAEYGARGRGIPVPLELVCLKILTAPDASSLTVYQDGERMGFCTLSSGVEQEMAKLDEGNLPPESLAVRAGYQIRLNGNVALGEFTNRLKFDGHLMFSPNREWRELDLRFSTHLAGVEIHSLAAAQTVSVQITADDETNSYAFTFADLQNPNAVLRTFGGDVGAGFWGSLEPPVLPPATADFARSLPWEARRVTLTMDREEVTAYRLQTQVLGQPVVIYINTLGEILRVELPGGITAVLDEWSN